MELCRNCDHPADEHLGCCCHPDCPCDEFVDDDEFDEMVKNAGYGWGV